MEKYTFKQGITVPVLATIEYFEIVKSFTQSGAWFYGEKKWYDEIIRVRMEGTTSDFPEDWLVEIKDEPVSAEEWSDYMVGLEIATQSCKEILSSNMAYAQKRARLIIVLNRVAKDSLKQGEANAELRHRETQTEYESYANLMNGTGNAEKHRYYKSGGNACKKSHNLT